MPVPSNLALPSALAVPSVIAIPSALTITSAMAVPSVLVVLTAFPVPSAWVLMVPVVLAVPSIWLGLGGALGSTLSLGERSEGGGALYPKPLADPCWVDGAVCHGLSRQSRACLSHSLSLAGRCHLEDMRVIALVCLRFLHDLGRLFPISMTLRSLQVSLF